MALSKEKISGANQEGGNGTSMRAFSISEHNNKYISNLADD